jgi:hypothetical protein
MNIGPLTTSQNEVAPARLGTQGKMESPVTLPGESICLGGGMEFSRKNYLGANLASLFDELPALESAPTAEAESETPAQAVTRDFQVEGASEGGFYQRIRGEGVDLSMARKSNYANIGGIYMETNPSYTIHGECAGLPVSLAVSLEDHVAEAGGINIQTGTTYHVEGNVGERKIGADITHEDEMTDVGGINVQTACRAHMKGHEGAAPDVTVQKVSIVQDLGGINVETDSYDSITGSDASGPVDVKARGLTGGEALSMEGAMPADTMALMLGLKPFLYAA